MLGRPVKHRYSRNRKTTSNRLLTALPLNDYEMLLPYLENVSIPFESSIYQIGHEMGHVYFPNSGIISLLASVEESSTIEVGIVGREGMVGLPLVLGVTKSSVKAIVQGEGTAMKMDAKDFNNECRRGGSLLQLLLRFTHSMMMQISQSAVCFRFHAIETRLARWLLMTSDRTETNEFLITQNFLSNMLGVRREAVNKAARSLQGKKLIAYGRSNIIIIDRPGLEATACACYMIVRNEEARHGAVR